MAEYQMTHSGAELDEAVGYVLDNYKDVTPVTATANDVAVGKAIVTSEGVVYGTNDGVSPPASWKAEAEGNPATVSDGLEGWPLYALSVELEPGQTGSGDPAPDNVRPITGHASAAVAHTGGQTYTITFPDDPGTVYGGTIDFRSGLLTVDRIRVIYNGTETGWSLSSSTYKRFAITVPTPLEAFDGTAAHFKGLCNMFKTGTITSSTTPMNSWWYYSTGDSNIYFFWDHTAWTGTGGTALAKWKAFLAEMAADNTPLTICVPLATPLTYHLSGRSLSALTSGTNTFTSGDGDITVGYFKQPEEVSE
jgi:hypothetical protein